MPLMAKKPSESARGRGRPANEPELTEVQVQTKMPQEMRDAITAFQDSLEFPPKLQEIGLKAFEEFLAKRGFWPKPRKDNDA